jgi:DNA-directed RNA polymerase subunit beta
VLQGGEEVEILETVDMGETDFRSLMNEDRKYRHEDENLGDHGYTAQEFQGEELVDVDEPEEEDDYSDDLGIEFNEISDDEF